LREKGKDAKEKSAAFFKRPIAPGSLQHAGEGGGGFVLNFRELQKKLWGEKEKNEGIFAVQAKICSAATKMQTIPKKRKLTRRVWDGCLFLSQEFRTREKTTEDAKVDGHSKKKTHPPRDKPREGTVQAKKTAGKREKCLLTVRWDWGKRTWNKRENRVRGFFSTNTF